MVYDVEQVVRDVRVALDQGGAASQLAELGDGDALALDEIIESKLEEAARRVVAQAPAHMLEEGHQFGDAIYWNGDCTGWALLPDDFQRLVVFEMSDWEQPVFAAITGEDPGYALQRSRRKGLRGSPQNPVCAIVSRPEGRALEFYSCKSEDAYARRAQYIPYASIDAEGGIDISERCYQAAVYTAAALTLTTLGEPEKAAAMQQLANTSIQ